MKWNQLIQRYNLFFKYFKILKYKILIKKVDQIQEDAQQAIQMTRESINLLRGLINFKISK